MSVLVVAPAWVGDAVMAHSLIGAVAAARPERSIDVVAPVATRPVFERMAEVRAVRELKAAHGEIGLGARWHLGRTLATGGYEVAYVLPNTWKSALVPFFAGIPLRVGYRGEARFGLLSDLRTLDVERLPRLIDRYAGLADVARGAAPLPRLIHDKKAGARLRKTFGLEPASRIVALAPGAEFGPAKRWPARHYADLATRRIERGDDVWLLGGPGDRPLAEEIVAATPEALRGRLKDLVGRTRLEDAIDLLGDVDALVTNDSGLMHVACALGRPVVALFGPTSSAYTPPLGGRARVLDQALSCAPCFERVCPLGHQGCLVDLRPARVDVALDDLLDSA